MRLAVERSAKSRQWTCQGRSLMGTRCLCFHVSTHCLWFAAVRICALCVQKAVDDTRDKADENKRQQQSDTAKQQRQIVRQVFLRSSISPLSFFGNDACGMMTHSLTTLLCPCACCLCLHLLAFLHPLYPLYPLCCHLFCHRHGPGLHGGWFSWWMCFDACAVSLVRRNRPRHCPAASLQPWPRSRQSPAA